MDIVKKVYYNPSTGFQNKKRLYEAVKDKGITKNQVNEFVRSQEVFQLHKITELPKHYIPIIAKYTNDILQIDLLDVSNLHSSNDGVHYIALAIDIFSRKLYGEPMKNKTAENVVKAFTHIIEKTKPIKIQCDQGKEFISKSFKELLNKYKIELQLVNIDDKNKIGIINRVCITIREMLNKYMTAYKTTRYIDAFQKLVDNYNNSIHSTILFTPNEAQKHVEEIQKTNTKRYNKAIADEKQFKVGDKVRCIVNLTAFEKHTLPHWSKIIHTITNRTEHSYTLDNAKTNKQYQLQLISNVSDVGLSTRTRVHQQIPSREVLKKKNTIKRRLKKEGLTLSDILMNNRTRTATDKFHY